MPSSDYEGFYVHLTDENGVIVTVSDADVVIYDVDGVADIDTVTSDGDGYIAPGTVALDPGARIRFRVENYLGLAGSVTQITT